MCKEIEGFPLTKIRKGVYIMFYLGIDIAKVNHVASLIGEDGSILVKAIKFTNSNEGLQKLIDSISDYDQSQIYCAMEATGDCWLSLFSALTDMDFNVSWIGSAYPNLEEFYGFIGNVVLWDRIQTTYLAWKNILYFDNYRWIALRLWEVFDWWLIREIDTDENGYPHSEIIFLIKGDENEENRTWINWYREMFTITAISKQNLENFKVTPDFMESVIWENNQYYFTLSVAGSSEYKDLIVFDVK